jgi:penicillin-binding protein 1A
MVGSGLSHPVRTTLLRAALPALLAAAASAEPRREITDRHGHPLAHRPPLSRDASCAPDLYALHAAGGPRRETRATLDGELQALAQLAIQRGVERLARAEARAPSASSPPSAPSPPSAIVRAVREDALQLDLGILPLPPPVECPGHPVPALPPPSARFHPGEALRVRVLGPRRLALRPQAALVALDPRTRDVLALVGGYGQHPGDFDRATQGRRQAGSTWKPLVYAAALASGRFSLTDTLWDLPRAYGGWHPRNVTGSFDGPVHLRQALARSINSVAVHVLSEIGPERVAVLAGRMGIPADKVPRDLTQALGTALVSPLQLAGAYAVFADTLHGRYLPPRLFEDDPVLAEDTPAALPPQIAYLVSSLLRSVVTEGSAGAARELRGLFAYGKTGTTSDGADAWFAGYHADLLCVVWVGEDRGLTGAESALPIWMDFMRAAAARRSSGSTLRSAPRPASRPLPRPPGLVETPLPGGGTELVPELAQRPGP